MAFFSLELRGDRGIWISLSRAESLFRLAVLSFSVPSRWPAS